MGNCLVVEYTDMPPSQRKLWLQRLVSLYAYVESLDVDALNHHRDAGVRAGVVKHSDAHVHARGVRE